MEATGTWALLLALALLLLLTLALSGTRARGHLPPGPTPLPLLGNLLQLRPGALYSGLMREEQNPGTEFTNKNMLMTVIYLLFAGTMTVSTTVGYTLLLLMKYPHVQKWVREELNRELGAGQAPSLGDRTRLPYTDAVLHEAQRLLALVPMGIPRTLMRTTRFRGYTLPQGTEVFP
ncbi:cytochrome P450 family 2 subfamily S member 1, partial [Homo sapiens]